GMGQRGLIVAPPRTGKTTLLHHIADAVTKNHPEMILIILLVDERPEEVTDFRRSHPTAELMASSNDADIKSHTRISQLAIERAKRLVEAGKHVFILLDSITRTARAFNNAMGGGGRTMSGGIDARAMEIPRKIFAAARNTEEAGSLTIVATALIETGSRMDELIFQEFKGTGNMEMVLDRKISDQRIYPAIDIFLSGTRREELLLQPWELEKINLIRRGLAGHKPEEAIQRLLMFVKKFPTNTQMLKEIPGIQRRLGLNPILDLVPGFGDIAAALVSVSVLIYGIRRGIPKILLGRMALNVLINELVGIVPIVGSVFAFWFTANTRNYELLREHLDTPNRSTKSAKIFVGAVLGMVILVIVAGTIGTLLILYAIGKLISRA